MFLRDKWVGLPGRREDFTSIPSENPQKHIFVFDSVFTSYVGPGAPPLVVFLDWQRDRAGFEIGK